MAEPGISLDIPRAGAVGSRASQARHRAQYAPSESPAPIVPPRPVPDGQPCAEDAQTDFAVLIVRGRIDLANLPVLRERLRRLSRAPGSLLIVDLSGVTACCALALGPLVAAARRARSQGGDLRLVQPSPAVLAALRGSGLNRLLPIFPGLDTATDTAAAGPQAVA